MAKGRKTGGRQKGTRNKSSNGVLNTWAEEKGIPFLQRIVDGLEKDRAVVWGKVVEVPAPLALKADVARYLIDQAKGKAPQRIQHEGDPDNPVTLILRPWEPKKDGA